MTPSTPLEQRTCVCIVGVGYVGESLLKQFGKVFDSIGFDISEDRIKKLRPIFGSSDHVQLTTRPESIGVATHFFIAVPTTLGSDNSVNLGHVRDAIDTVLTYASRGSCIVIESSVPVGTTRQLLGPYQDDFFCGMSPERIDPGRVSPSPEEIPKLVSGLGLGALKRIHEIYSSVFKEVIDVSRPEVAEMTKLYENCYRMVNIAYVNEISDACKNHGVDPTEVIQAASSKPFGYQPFYPGLGVGGHCIPVNPFYLFANNKNLPILHHATMLMTKRPQKLARRFHRRCFEAMERRQQPWPMTMPRIVVVGVGFKIGQGDTSGSPALAFLNTLHELGCTRLAFYDPLVEGKPFDWLEKLTDFYWNAEYIDSKFDGLYICNAVEPKVRRVLPGLKKIVVGSFV